MSYWQWEDAYQTAPVVDECAHAGDPDFQDTALAAGPIGPMSSHQQVTTKIPPSYNGSGLWFTYEEQVGEWEDLTELAVEKRGPALKSRLEGTASIYKNFLDRETLKSEQGVDYFLRTLRPYFVKGAFSTFLWRFMQLFRMHRSGGDFLH